MALAGYVMNFSTQFDKIASESLMQKSYHTVTGQDALTLSEYLCLSWFELTSNTS